MHDDETRHARDDMPRWQPDDRDGGQGDYGQGRWGGEGDWSTQGAGWTNGATPTMTQPPRRSVGSWAVPVLLVLAGLAAFVVVTFFMRGHSASDGTSAQNTVQSNPAQSTGTSASSPTTAAAFPSGTLDTCEENGVLVDNPDKNQIKLLVEPHITCEYVANLKNEVLAQLQNGRPTGEFTVYPRSPKTNDVIPATCSSQPDHLTYCHTKGSTKAWIRDSFN